MKVEVLKIKKFDGEGKRKAVSDIQIGGIVTVYGCSLVLGPKGLFVSMPHRKQEIAGQPAKYWNIVRVEEGLLRQITEAVISAYASEETEAPKTPQDIKWND